MAVTADTGLHRGWVLHSRSFRNTSLIVEFLTDTRGRCGVVARAGRRNSLLQPFRPLCFALSGQGELARLGHIEAGGPAPALRGRALYCGFYINEVLMRMLHREDPQPGLLDLYEQTLTSLQRDTAHDIVLRRFEMALLEQLGYGFPLDRDAQGQRLDPRARYSFYPEQGLLPARDGLEGGALLELAAGEWTEPARYAARGLMRSALAPHLGERPLKSRSLFRRGE
jgi:DNA repair protein RecO (recombination protein O)